MENEFDLSEELDPDEPENLPYNDLEDPQELDFDTHD
jgi:hypothetical protein